MDPGGPPAHPGDWEPMSWTQERFEWILARLRAIGPRGALVSLTTRLRLASERNGGELLRRRIAWVAEAADTSRFHFLWDEGELEDLLEVCRAQGEALDAAGEDLLEGELLGVQGPAMEAPFPWTRSPLDQADAARHPWHSLLTWREEEMPGLRLVLEAGRLQALSVLAALSRIDRHPARADQAFALLRDFADRNPYSAGPHWLFPEEVAIRLLSLLWFRALLGEQIAERGLDAFFAGQVYAHQRFLSIFDEEGPIRDHRRFLIAGAQLAAAVAMPWFPESAYWEQQARDDLERELLEQVHPDGVGREQNSDAETLALEVAFLASRLCDRHAFPLARTARARIRAMAEYFVARAYHREPATRSGQLHGGRAFFVPTAANERGESLRVALALAYEEEGWVRGTVQLDPQALFLVGSPDAAATFESWTADTMMEPYVPEEVFPRGGRYFFRSTQAPGLTLGFDGGNHGLGPSYLGAHADLMAVTIEVGGRPVIADPGSLLRPGVPGWNDYLRSTGAHSSVRINWDSSSIPGPGESWIDPAEPKDRGYAVNGEGRLLMATAAHEGYRFRDGRVIHRRSVTRDHGNSVHLAIEDQFFGDYAEPVEFEILFHFHPRVTAIHHFRETYQVPLGETTLCFRFCSDSPLDVRATKGHEAPYLGWYAVTPYRVEPSWVLRVAGHERLPVAVRTAIFPT